MAEDVLSKMRSHATRIFKKALQAVEPFSAVQEYCRVRNGTLFIDNRSYQLANFKNIYIIGFGKATAPMAQAVESILGDKITSGVILVKYGHTAELKKVRTIEAGHPVPDSNGMNGTEEILSLLTATEADDLVLCLVSGGGSALLSLPCKNISLKDKQETNKILLSCGASIHEMNAIRKHISKVKGGRLAETIHPATLISLILSDVVGDDLDVIASGPTVPDQSTYQECMKIILKYDMYEKLPKSVVHHIEKGMKGSIPESPKPGNSIFQATEHVIIGSNTRAVIAAEREAQKLNYHTIILSSMIEGETKEVAKVHTAIAKEILRTGNPITTPACILSGGETTVTIRGDGLGGRNQEFVLSTVRDIASSKNIVVLSGGTDGNDGPTDAAGAVADSGTLARAFNLGLNPEDYLANNDSYHFFKEVDRLLITGPTNTNVMDLRVILVDKPNI